MRWSPPERKAIDCRWAFSLIKNKEADVERFKARLVVKGCSQVYGINGEIFSPVVRYGTMRMVFVFAVKYELHLHQMDVSSAYLNSELDDDIYITQPE